MTHGDYIGFDETYEGCSALLRESEKEGKILAQFDRIGLGRVENMPGCHGWHEFDEWEFVVDNDEE